jgi:hypothetical protein
MKTRPLGKTCHLGVLFLAVFAGLTRPVSAASGLFVKTPPAPHAFVLNVAGDSSDSRATAFALQGLVNRSSAEVYINSRSTDQEQLDFSRKPYTVLSTGRESDRSLRGAITLFEKYHRYVKKLFVYDIGKDWTFNLALMAGAQADGIPVTREIRDALRARVPEWSGTVEDFTKRGADRVEGYTWALKNLMPNCTREAVYVSRNFPLNVLDHVVSSKSFIFTLNAKVPAELELITKIFATRGYGVGTSLGGYAGDSINRLANPHGIGYTVSNFYSNKSFWLSFPNKTYTQPAPKAITAQRGKVYVAFVLSDGDNLQFDQSALYLHWKDPARGTVPVGTSLAPVLQEINTPLLDWYYAKKTPNDELIAGPCGFQFIYLDDFREDLLPAWCRLNAKWCADAGFRTVSVWHGTFPSKKYDIYTSLSGVHNIRHNSNRISNAKFSNGVPVFMERLRDCWTEEEIYEDLSDVERDPRFPTFVTGKLISAGFDRTIFTSIKKTVDRLNKEFPGKYVFQLPADQAETAKVYYRNNRSALEKQTSVQRPRPTTRNRED